MNSVQDESSKIVLYMSCGESQCTLSRILDKL
jgi:hypothetical protein